MFSLACLVISCGNSFRVFFIMGLSDRHKTCLISKSAKLKICGRITVVA